MVGPRLGLVARHRVGPGLVARCLVSPGLVAERRVGPRPVMRLLVVLLLTGITHRAAALDHHLTVRRLAASRPGWVRSATRTGDVRGGGKHFLIDLPKGLIDLEKMLKIA